jgi:uncharacterized heparinase superfamily protein
LKVGLLWRTLPYLRREQIVYRPWRVAQFRLYRALPGLARRWVTVPGGAPDADARAVGAVRSLFDNAFVHLRQPLESYHDRLADLVAGKFTFLNRTVEIREVDWSRRYESHLWNYQLHYFSYAVWCARAWLERGDARPMRRCQALIDGWIGRARPGQSDGWDAYPVSRRAVNWIYAYALLDGSYDDHEFMGRWRASLYGQLDFLSRHLELHLLANHLLANAKALTIGGLFFAGDGRGRRWLDEGGRLLWRELDEQVLADGGHYERAPMYHALALADFLECYALLRERGLAPPAEARLRAMAGFLEAMTYPDGTLALFNDSANAEEARPLPILAAAERICGRAEPALDFPLTGYFRWVSPDGAERIVVDAGPPAADYNTAHAHCDLLSYELWLGGRPVVVDAGVHGYGGDQFREYARSTRAHNTVSFGGREQSEIWGSFRVARRAAVTAAEARGGAQTWEFRGAYRPYYDARAEHERRIRREAGGDWVFADTARGGAAGRAESFIHLHPGVEARVEGGGVECRAGSLRFRVEPFGAEQIEIADGWHFPDFGLAQPSQTIKLSCRARAGEAFGYRISSQLSAVSQTRGSLLAES